MPLLVTGECRSVWNLSLNWVKSAPENCEHLSLSCLNGDDLKVTLIPENKKLQGFLLAVYRAARI